MTAFQKVRRPLVGIACSLVVGLYAHPLFGGTPLLFLGLAAIALAWICWNPQRRSALAAFYIACALLAAAYGSIEEIVTPASSVLSVAEGQFREQEVTGRIDEPPAISREDGTLSFRFRAEAVRLGAEWFRCDKMIRVYINNPAAIANYGERWRIKGRYRSYDKLRAGVGGSLVAAGNAAIRLRAAPPSFRTICYGARLRALQILSTGMESFSEQNRLLSALLLGYRRALAPALYQTFAYTGTLHIFAISGLHVGVLASILIAGLKIIGVPRPVWGIVLIPALFFYVVSTGMKPSAFRAFTMASVYFAAPLVGRRPDSVSAIALAAIILLAINPLQINDPGFLLSFTVVSGIVMVHGYMTRRLAGFSRPGWAIQLAQLSGPRPLMAGMRTIGLLALTSVAAWIFSAPLTARFFNTLSPVALAGNLVIIPLTFMILLTGCLSLASAPISLSVVIIFNHANRIFVSLLISAIKWIGTLPGAYLFVRSPSPAVLALWYAGLVLFFTGTARLRRFAVLILTVAILLWGKGASHPFSGIEIHRSGGMATLIRMTPARWILVTVGNPYGVASTVRQLQRQGVNHLYALVISDRRAEASAIEQLYKTFSPEQVWIAPDSGACLSGKLEAAGIPVTVSGNPAWKTGAGSLRISTGY